jgi:predicted Zn-dependent peptidase
MTISKPTEYAFQTVPGDPLKALQYTLPNGLKLLMSVNANEPRIYTKIAVRAGAKHDPADATGLAHYMEHMLFKGSSRLGALDWEREKDYLQQITDLYERYRQTEEAQARAEIYAEIDRLSFAAAQLAAASEYDKLASAMGAKSTNAYTWVEQTVYVNDIPSNELERWMRLESERFRMLALRLFHTELETVYEEFNIGQDQDTRKANNAIRSALFPQHPYGTQPTIGLAQHLKNPSLAKIQAFFKTYYVPNNMAIIMAGDFQPEEAVRLAERYFGRYEPQLLPPFTYEEQRPLYEPQRLEVFGQQASFVDIAWRFNGTRTDEPFMLALIEHLLHNNQAGLLDLGLNQQQRVLDSHAWSWVYEDYAAFGLYAKPRQGQSLEDAERLLLGELQKLKNGDFEDWLLPAVIRDLRLQEVVGNESNQSRAGALAQSFILGIDWERMTQRFAFWEGRSKAEIAAFARQHLREDNCVILYKQQGEDPNVIKVEKPPITPVELQRDALSQFGRDFLALASPPLAPVFADFERGISRRRLDNSLAFDYVRNPDNELFRVDFVFEMGKFHHPLLPMALLYLPYLGTRRFSAPALQQKLFSLALSFDYKCNNKTAFITLSGLDESLEEGLRLLEHFLAEALPDQAALQRVVDDVLKKRANGKKDRANILSNALTEYARYGADSPFTFRPSAAELQALEAEQLTGLARSLFSYEHTIHYYGPRAEREVATLLDNIHRVPAQRLPPPPARHFAQLPTDNDEVLLVDFPMVQTDVLLLSRGTPRFSMEQHLMREWYNEYFGYGLSSIVFQEIRESRALAYSTYALYTSPHHHDEAHYLKGYVGTQPDKLRDAIPALAGIIEEMPFMPSQAEHARQSIMRRIESERILPSDLYWEARATARLGYQEDLRRYIYEHLQSAPVGQLQDFQQEHVKGRAFKYLVLGSRHSIDLSFLEKIGPLRELSLEEIFGDS